MAASVTAQLPEGKRTSIVCLGNELRGDDGVGVHVARVIAALELPPGVDLQLLVAVGLDLADILTRTDLVVLVDALHTSTAPPGTCLTIGIERLARPGTSGAWSVHETGLVEVLELAAALRGPRPLPRVVVVGVEALVLDQYRNRLSQPVRSSFPELVVAVLRAAGVTDRAGAAVEVARRYLAELE